MDFGVARDIVAVVLERRGIKRQKPKRRDAEILKIIEFLRQPFEIADAIGVAVRKGADMKLINDRVLIPKRIIG